MSVTVPLDIAKEIGITLNDIREHQPRLHMIETKRHGLVGLKDINPMFKVWIRPGTSHIGPKLSPQPGVFNSPDVFEYDFATDSFITAPEFSYYKNLGLEPINLQNVRLDLRLSELPFFNYISCINHQLIYDQWSAFKIGKNRYLFCSGRDPYRHCSPLFIIERCSESDVRNILTNKECQSAFISAEKMMALLTIDTAAHPKSDHLSAVYELLDDYKRAKALVESHRQLVSRADQGIIQKIMSFFAS